MGFFAYCYHVWDTISYIREHGWDEWRKARRRYDQHQEAVKNLQSKFSKVAAIKQANRLKKLKR